MGIGDELRDPGPVESVPDPALLLDQVERLNGFGCFVLYPESGQAFWSDGLYRLLGLPPRSDGESAPASYVDVYFARVHPDDLDRVRDGHARLAAEGIVVDTTYRIVRLDGTTLLVRASGAATRRDDGVVVRIVGALVDVTQVSLTENRLAEADALLAETQRAAGVGSHVYDLTTGRLEWSPTLYDILGVDPSVVPTGELSVEITHPSDRATQLEWGTSLVRGETAGPVVTRIVRSDGALRYIESRGRRVDSDGGKRIMGVTIDVTARVELEERLRQAAKMEAVGTLAAGVAHDFNNYLTVMALEVDAITASPARIAPAVGALRGAIGRCASLTAELLAFARKRTSASTAVELRTVVEATAGLFARASGPNVTVDLRLPEVPVHVSGDASQLGNVVMNLLLNARDALPDGGKVTVTVEARTLDASDHALEPGAPGGRYARLVVADEGAGIAPEDLGRIFEPYFTTKAPGRNSGLGLASVYGIVKQHAGFVRVRSAKGEGSTFEVYLPAAQGQPELATAPRRDDAPLSGTVLVVEDTDPLRAILCRILEDAGLVVHAAGSGDEAIGLLNRLGGVDVVLTDVIMPGMSGCDLAQEVARIAPAARVVFMSGYVDAALLARIEQSAPGRPLVHKPFDREELLGVLSVALSARAAASS